jgi:hypothetical protein
MLDLTGPGQPREDVGVTAGDDSDNGAGDAGAIVAGGVSASIAGVVEVGGDGCDIFDNAI